MVLEWCWGVRHSKSLHHVFLVGCDFVTNPCLCCVFYVVSYIILATFPIGLKIYPRGYSCLFYLVEHDFALELKRELVLLAANILVFVAVVTCTLCDYNLLHYFIYRVNFNWLLCDCLVLLRYCMTTLRFNPALLHCATTQCMQSVCRLYIKSLRCVSPLSHCIIIP